MSMSTWAPLIVTVALLTECVDRNLGCGEYGELHGRSHSLRSAWIEILVDTLYMPIPRLSHSLRSAWIEIFKYLLSLRTSLVALLTECVDRNKIKQHSCRL